MDETGLGHQIITEPLGQS